MKQIYCSRKSSLDFIVFVVLLFVLGSCSNSSIKKEFLLLQKGDKDARGIEMIYPWNNTIFPPEFPAPTFEWGDSVGRSTQWSVCISDTEGNLLIDSKSFSDKWKPDSLDWENLKSKSVKSFIFTVIGEKKNKPFLPSGQVRFSFASDSVGADIFYRAVTLPFSYAVKNVHTIEWYLGNVDGRKPRKMLDNLPVCGNCHSFAQEQPILAMDVDYGNDKGSYVIAEAKDTCNLKSENIITWSDYKKEDKDPTFGLLSQISPDGNHVLSTVKDLSIFVAVDNNMAYSQLFFPIKGIVGIYDRMNDSFSELKGANDPKYVQSNPTWSPDGQTVVFAKTEAYVNEKVRKAGIALLTLDDVNEFSSGEKEFKYDLYSVDFNNGKGGETTPLKGASNNGKSNYFPKFSPDGKWIVFCQAENFMLLQPDSRLYIMPAEGGEPRLMNCNMDEMNSWHSWSPNGRWLVFSSKNRGLYTQLYLTHIDENGIDSPPVLLENLRFDKRAANIPEFYPFKGDDFKVIKDAFSNTAEYFNRGAFDKMSNKYYKRALDDVNKAIQIDSNCLESYFNRIMLNNLLRQANSKQDLADKKKAMQLVEKSLTLKPLDEDFLSLRISLLSNMGREGEAIKEARLAISTHPSSYKLFDLLGSIYRKENQFEKAIDCYKNMLRIEPKNKQVINSLIIGAYMNLNKDAEALKLVDQSIQEHPNNDDLLALKVQILLKNKNMDQALPVIEQLIASDSANYSYSDLLAQYYLVQGNKRLYFFQKQHSVRLLESAYLKNKEDVDLIFEMAADYMALNDLENAEKKYNLILNVLPSNYEALKQKAKIELTMQHWAEAIAVYDLLEANYPAEEGFCNNKAIAYIQLGNFSKALEYFDKTIEINPNNKDAIFNRNKLKMDQTLHR